MSENPDEKYDVMASSERAAALSSETSVFLNVAKFEQMQRVAIMLSKSDFVPSRFRGNVGNCMIALDMAALMNMHVLMLMRTMYVVHGEPGFEGKFVSALINNSGRYTDPLEYEWRGKKGQPEWGCRAFATRKSTKKTVYGPWVDLKMVHDEKWHLPKGNQTSKWVTMPEIMFMYRAASFFGKTNDSDLLMGMQTVDELEDISADLTRRPDGKYAMTSSEKQTVSYEATAQAPPPPETEPLPDLSTATETETETPLLETEAARTLAGLAGKHRREYLMVVKGRTPETIEQIFEWIEAINQLVVDHAQQPPQSNPGQEKF